MPTPTPVPDSELANAVRALAMDAVDAVRSGHPIVDHRTYVFVGDGCLMEGLSHEACSLAGTLGEKEFAGARAALGWAHPPFVIPARVYDAWSVHECGGLLEAAWNRRFAAYRAAHPALAAAVRRVVG